MLGEWVISYTFSRIGTTSHSLRNCALTNNKGYCAKGTSGRRPRRTVLKRRFVRIELSNIRGTGSSTPITAMEQRLAHSRASPAAVRMFKAFLDVFRPL